MVTCNAPQLTSQFCAKAFKRGIADYSNMATSSAHVARNKGIIAFLTSMEHRKKTHIFFLDDDSTPVDDFVLEQMLAYSNRRNRPVVAGVTPIFRVREAIDFSKLYLLDKGIVQNLPVFMDFHWSAILRDEKTGQLSNIGIDEMPKTPFKAHRVGGTCLLVRRDVLEKLERPYQKWEYAKDGVNVERSEDIYFSDKIRDAGFDIWVMPEAVCHHYHTMDILDLFMVAMQAKSMGQQQ